MARRDNTGKSGKSGSNVADAMLRGFAKLSGDVQSFKDASDPEKADYIASRRFPVQQRVADDKNPFVAVLCPRRAGKSYTALSIAIERCLRKDHVIAYIVGLTKPSIKRIYWSYLLRLNADPDMALGLKFHHTELTATFPNGSQLAFMGGDSRAEMEKMRGLTIDLVVLDECKSFGPKLLEEFISDIITPALGDRDGQLILIGTPGTVLFGPFYEATCTSEVIWIEAGDGSRIRTNRPALSPTEDQFVWSFHTWTALENTSPEGVKAWASALRTKKLRGWKDDHPTWRREYLAEWVAEDNILVYRIRPHRHVGKGPIPGERGGDALEDLVYISGVDFGHKDGFAVFIWVFSKHERCIYEVVSQKASRLTITEMADMIKLLEAQCKAPVSIRMGDPGGGGLSVMHTLSVEHGLAFRAAEKHNKNHFIELLNQSLDENLIQFRAGSPTVEEMVENRWLEKTVGTPGKREDPKTPNDLCDAALYSFREAWHRLGSAKPVTATVEKYSSAAMKAAYAARLAKERSGEQEWSEEDHWI